MKKTILLYILIIYSVNLAAQDDYIPLNVNRNNAFSLEYFSTVRSNTENCAVSPFGISCAMAMLYIGGEGNTQKVIAEKMNFITPFGVLFGYKQLLKKYQIYRTNDINLLFGNALWIGSKAEIQKKYKNLLKVNFNAHVQEINFKDEKEAAAKLMNRWVKKSSNFNLLSIVRPEDIKNIDELVYSNYMFLDGAWENPFNEQLTQKEDFFLKDGTRKKVDFMNQTSYLKYNENDIFQILELPYSGNNISMILILPKNDTYLDSVERSLNLVNYDFWTGELYTKLVNLSLPKFKIEQTQIFSKVEATGNFELAFSNKSDYSNISKEPIQFSRMIQKTIIQVVENKNNSNIETFGSPDNKNKGKENTFIDFKANRPFIFVISDNQNNCILMVGKVNIPGVNNLSAEYYK